MIVSHRHRFIFIKNRKVGGTSVEHALAQICGPDDIITRDHIHYVETDVLAPFARNDEGAYVPVRELISDPRPISLLRTLRDCAKRPKYYNHMPASAVRHRIGPKTFNAYYVFTFERNPWDKVVSFFYWRHRNRDTGQSLNEYILSKPRNQTIDQYYPTDWRRYTRHDRVIVDEVFDYADMQQGLRTALDRAGVDKETIAQISLPTLKSGIRKSRGIADLSVESRDRIAEVFRREIDYMGFELPNS